MEEYKEFRDAMDVLEKFIERCATKEIDGDVFIRIDDSNVDEFKDIVENLVGIATSDEGYVDEILEYLNEIDRKITDRNMIAKFIPLFAAMNCLAKMTTLPLATKTEIKVDDWVFELHDLDESVPPLDARIGKVTNVINKEDGTITYTVKLPLSNNELFEWDDATFIVIPEMEITIKKYQEKYVKTF